MVRSNIKYMSPTSLGIFDSDPELYYVTYIVKEEREPQTINMAWGSSFDAYVKSTLYTMFGGVKDDTYKFENLFEAQVEPHNRDNALIEGKRIYDFYISCGGM